MAERAKKAKTDNGEIDNEKIKTYELGFLIASTVAEEEVGAYFVKIKDMVEGIGGAVVSEQIPTKHALAYTINRAADGKNQKFNQAYFGWITFDANAETAVVLDKILRGEEYVVRFVILKIGKNKFDMQKTGYSILSRQSHEEKKKVEAERKKEEVMMSDAELEKTIEDLVVE